MPFYARIGQKVNYSVRKKGMNRNSKDKKVNKEGDKLHIMVENKQWNILNKKINGDEQEKYTEDLKVTQGNKRVTNKHKLLK